MACLFQTSAALVKFLEAFKDQTGHSFGVGAWDSSGFAKAAADVTLGDAYLSYVRLFLHHFAKARRIAFKGVPLKTLACRFLLHLHCQDAFHRLEEVLLQKRSTYADVQQCFYDLGWPETKAGRFVLMVVARHVWFRCRSCPTVFQVDQITEVFWGAARSINGMTLQGVHTRMVADIAATKHLDWMKPFWLPCCTQHALCDKAQTTHRARKKRRHGASEREAKRQKYHPELFSK